MLECGLRLLAPSVEEGLRQRVEATRACTPSSTDCRSLLHNQSAVSTFRHFYSCYKRRRKASGFERRSAPLVLGEPGLCFNPTPIGSTFHRVCAREWRYAFFLRDRSTSQLRTVLREDVGAGPPRADATQSVSVRPRKPLRYITPNSICKHDIPS